MSSELGEHLRRTRKGLGLTQEQLARIFRVSRKTINRIENGLDQKRPLRSRERMRIWSMMNQGANNGRAHTQ